MSAAARRRNAQRAAASTEITGRPWRSPACCECDSLWPRRRSRQGSRRKRRCVRRRRDPAGLTPPTSAPELGSPLPYICRDWARPCHICAGTGLTPPTSAPGLGSALPHLRRDRDSRLYGCSSRLRTRSGRCRARSCSTARCSKRTLNGPPPPASSCASCLRPNSRSPPIHSRLRLGPLPLTAGCLGAGSRSRRSLRVHRPRPLPCAPRLPRNIEPPGVLVRAAWMRRTRLQRRPTPPAAHRSFANERRRRVALRASVARAPRPTGAVPPRAC